METQMHTHNDSSCCIHDHSVITPVEHTHKSIYSHPPISPQRPVNHGFSRQRFWSVLFKEHSFVGNRLYTAQLHFALGICVWMAGIYNGSFALMCFSSLVIFDGLFMFIGLVPRVLEYSDNGRPSVEYPVGLEGRLETLLGFANGLGLVYRAVQALKEGVEHMVIHTRGSLVAVSGREHGGEELGMHLAGRDMNGHGVFFAYVSVLAALAVSLYGAARHGNHAELWQMRKGSNGTSAAIQGYSATGMHNALRNPYNISTVFASVCVLVALGYSDAESTVGEPLCCVFLAGIMGYVGIPTCVGLGKSLLLAVRPGAARQVGGALDRIAGLPGVVRCSKSHVWDAADGRYAVALRVLVDRHRVVDGADANALQGQIKSIFESCGLVGSWTVEASTFI